MPTKFCSLPCLIMISVLFSARLYADTSTKWSYIGSTGPTHWGMLDSSFELCDIGKAQSPINIDRKKSRVPYALKLNYHEINMHLDDGKGLRLNAPADSKEAVVYNGKEYTLVKVDFHSPSETLWHKQSYPLEIQFTHQNKDKELLVLAVFVNAAEKGAALNALQSILTDPTQTGSGADIKVSLDDMVPSDKRYYAFDGSLTTPPCTQGVHWVVLPTPVTATPAQILQVRQKIGGSNARPVQPLNGRTLYYAVE